MNDTNLVQARESSRHISTLLRHEQGAMADRAAHFRKVAARVVQRFPEVIDPLREGKLCLTSIAELARVMTPENSGEVLPRFFHMSKRQAKAVAAVASWSLQGGVHMAEPRHGCRVSSRTKLPRAARRRRRFRRFR